MYVWSHKGGIKVKTFREHIVIIDGNNSKDSTLDGEIGHRDLGWPYVSTPSEYE